MNKSDLKGGMSVRNKISGNTGTVQADEDGELGYADYCVGVHTRTLSGKHKGRARIVIWVVDNLEIIS